MLDENLVRDPSVLAETVNLPTSRPSPGDRTMVETSTLLDILQTKAPIGLGFVDRDFRVVRINECLAAINGATVADLLGRTVAEAVPGLWPQLEPLYRLVLENGEPMLDVELIGSTPADPDRPHCWSASYYPVSLGDETVGVGVIVIDVTERRQAETELEFQAVLLSAVGQAVIATDPAGIITYWNSAATELYGWKTEEAIGRLLSSLLVSRETQLQAEAILTALQQGRPWSGEFSVKRRDGQHIPVYVTDTPVYDEDGRLIAIIGVSTDISERRAADEVRRQLAAIVDGSGDAIYGLSVSGIVTSWNAAAEDLFGFTRDEMIGQHVSRLATDDGVREQDQMRDRLKAGGPHENFETVRRRKDGSFVDVRITASTVTDELGRVVGISVIAHDITERRQEQADLEASSALLAEAQRIAKMGSFRFDLRQNKLTWSDELYRILSIDGAVVPSVDLLHSLVHPDDLASAQVVWANATKSALPFDFMCRIISDSRERSVRYQGVPEVNENGEVIRLVGTLTDETERLELERVRNAAETRFEVGFEQSAIGTIIADAKGSPTRVNAAVCRLLDRPAELLIGRYLGEYTHPDDTPLAEAVRQSVAAGNDTYKDERRYLRPDGSVVWASSHVTLVRSDSGEIEYCFVQLEDITGRKTMEQSIAHQVYYDSLTDLPNRAFLTERLAKGLADSRRADAEVGVIFVDIDQFKIVNDSLGHSCGDSLLQHLGREIARVIRPGDTVARFGGDEFVIVCDSATIDETEQIAERVLAAVTKPCQIDGRELNITASLGITVADGSATPESLLRDSDTAMYRAKELGRGRIEMFDHRLRKDTEQRLRTTSEIHRALANNEFTVYYQPVVDLRNGTLVGAEALLRWWHPDRGLVAPHEFITLAEERGLIIPIGAWVLEQACEQLRRWQQVDPAMSVAVNFSVRQLLDTKCVDLVGDVLARTATDSSCLSVEMTESIFMGDVDYFSDALGQLKALGVRLSLDDFGTGYSSLSYLKRFPFDAVKVDRSFVDGLGTDCYASALVTAIVAMADALELEVTAEGVETAHQFATLKDLGCHRAQGFHLARPMDADSFAQLVNQRPVWNVRHPLAAPRVS